MTNLYDVVMFHYPCQDGLTSAWITNYYHKSNNKIIDLYPIKHGDNYDFSRLENKRLIICDYAPSIEILDELEKKCSEIKILDHHITAKESLHDKSYAIFDMNKSGAGLTWEYFFPDIEIPLFIKMVQDRDLWKWLISDSKDFTAGLFTLCDSCDYYDFDKIFMIFDNIFTNQNMFNFCMSVGEVVNKANCQKAKAIAEAASKRIDKFMGKNVCIVNCSVEHASEVGNILSSMDSIDFAVMWTYKNPTESYNVSLRSSDKVDVSKIAKAYGGGGHPNAAGLTTKIFPPVLFNNPIVKIE
jgi:oligoribonuclease NrnB/cAMP/cGMP phosphodiesterase (DHH superfamily)